MTPKKFNRKLYAMKVTKKVDSFHSDINAMASVNQICEKDIGLLSNKCRFFDETLATFQTKVK